MDRYSHSYRTAYSYNINAAQSRTLAVLKNLFMQ